jgi:anaerobic ribonucleoside-triphosphate reductase activating protein
MPTALRWLSQRIFWGKHAGLPLSPAVFLEYLTKYQNFIACVLFFGGEWNKEKLIPLLKATKERGLKTCLYSGKTKLHHELLRHLDFVKLNLKTLAWWVRSGINKPTFY